MCRTNIRNGLYLTIFPILHHFRGSHLPAYCADRVEVDILFPYWWYENWRVERLDYGYYIILSVDEGLQEADMSYLALSWRSKFPNRMFISFLKFSIRVSIRRSNCWFYSRSALIASRSWRPLSIAGVFGRREISWAAIAKASEIRAKSGCSAISNEDSVKADELM